MLLCSLCLFYDFLRISSICNETNWRKTRENTFWRIIPDYMNYEFQHCRFKFHNLTRSRYRHIATCGFKSATDAPSISFAFRKTVRNLFDVPSSSRSRRRPAASRAICSIGCSISVMAGRITPANCKPPYILVCRGQVIPPFLTSFYCLG